MTWAAALFAVAAFVVAARWLRIAALGRTVLGHGRQATRTLRDPALADRDKERAARAHAVRLLGLSLAIAVRAAAAFALPVGALALLDRTGVVDLGAVVRLGASPWFLVAAAATGTAVAVVLPRRGP
ncbi:MAG: hypothetical protein AB7O97_21805 [Planctomycetota bacterium]